ncbi:type II toxin-antitoxin system PemK/MazF family toxin [Salana multivorans]
MRGDVYRLRAPRNAKGHEQLGMRYAVVVQSDDLLLSTVLVAPTSTKRAPASFRPEVEIDGERTRILLEQTTAVDPDVRLGEFAGRLSVREVAELDDSLRVVLGLD